MNNGKRILLLRMPSPALQKVSHPVHYYPPLTLKYIQSILKKETQLDVNLIDGWVNSFAREEFSLLNNIYSYEPDIMVISSNFVNLNPVLVFLNKIKHSATYIEASKSHTMQKKEIIPLSVSCLKNLFIIAIGHNVTWDKERFLFPGSPIDVIIPGEAEKEVPDLIIKLCSGKINKDQARELYREQFKKEDSFIVLNNPDSLPFPEFSKEEMLKYFFIYPVRLNKRIYCGYIKTSWGCPHRCIFCSQAIRKSYGRSVRLRNPKNVVDEIEHLMEKGANFISFEDDNFTSSRSHVLHICQEIKRRGLKIKWAAQGRIDEVDNYLLQEMKSANCELLQFGVESGAARIIRLLRKTEYPELWIPKSKKVFEEARKVGIATCALFIIGSPTETAGEVKESIRLVRSLKPDLLKIHFFYPYPGSIAYRTFFKELKGLEPQNVCHYEHPQVTCSKMNIDEMIELRKEFYKEMYLKPRFIAKHLFRYFGYYLHNPKNLKSLVNKTTQLFLFK